MARIGLEAGSLSPWLCHELLAIGHPVICKETRHAKAAMQAEQVKTDRNDASGLAHIMRTGWFKEVHVKSHRSQKLRILLGNRRSLLEKRLDVDNQIRGTIKVFGLTTGRVTVRTFEMRILELMGDDQELHSYIVRMF
jgi:transposase